MTEESFYEIQIKTEMIPTVKRAFRNEANRLDKKLDEVRKEVEGEIPIEAFEAMESSVEKRIEKLESHAEALEYD